MDGRIVWAAAAAGLLLIGADAQAQSCGTDCHAAGCGCRDGRACSCGTDCRCGRNTGGDDEPHRWSDEWYARRAHLPFASSQKCKHGLAYPPYPRPTENAEFSAKCHAAHYWPYPYSCWDRAYTRDILALQAANGWAGSTTLFAYHFHPETQCLNTSGVNHLRWILDNTPSQFRTVYVQPADDLAGSEARLASVESNIAADATGYGPAVAVTLRDSRALGRPAGEVDVIRRAELQSMPQPRLPFTSIAGGGGAPAGP